jgi:hypothetical protein
MAYNSAVDNDNSTQVKKEAARSVRSNGYTSSSDPTYSAGLIPPGLQGADRGPGTFLHCEPVDPALELVAPTSHLNEASPRQAGVIAQRMPPVCSSATSSDTDPVQVTSRLQARFPRIPPPIRAALLEKAPVASELPVPIAVPQAQTTSRAPVPPQAQLTLTFDRSKITRGALLAVSFVGVAVATHLILGPKNHTSTLRANQAPVASLEDFSGGLGQWEGAEAGQKPWKLEPSKGVEPHSLALFRNSKGMADYRLEFTADVAKNGVSWAVRAANPRNYQALQITQRKTGAETQLWLTRYTVKSGKDGPRTQVPLQIQMPAQSVWLIRLEAIGDSCTLWVENQIANSWSEASLPGGSIGFFAGKGDEYMLKKVRITPQ